MMKFASEENNGEEAIVYPRKVLALYKDSEGTLKVLVHSVEYKTATNVEGPFGDSCLVTHYQLEFNQNNGKPRMYSVKVDSILHVIVAYEAIQYPHPLVPQVRCIHSHWEHSNDSSTKKRMGKTVPCMDKRTKRETQAKL
jgi:hypothetical protein